MAWFFQLFFPMLLLIGTDLNAIDGEWLLALGLFTALGFCVAVHIFFARIELSHDKCNYRSIYGAKYRKGSINRSDIENVTDDGRAFYFKVRMRSSDKIHQVHYGYLDRENIIRLGKWLKVK
jgi:hypothetical protein